MSSEQLKAWIAALVDGEGSLSVMFDRDGCLDLRGTISNTNRELLDTIKERLGFGTICTTGKPAKETWKEGFQWRCFRGDVVKLIDIAEPFLIVKREKAILIRALAATISSKDPAALIRRAKLLELWDTLPKRPGRGNKSE